ncbi:cytochrome c oxidase, subunit II [Pseudooceanicola batsensis HTCC2597]|uniref:Cytochrome c oxidase subunit 2 n=2 Tax=Pseudooceanicola batsensis TaxID=314255 RepID=A3TZ51_PSEBH|nr:cytochrome c oxidase, subunit II [Pseudooceanicola batsensis HTCC2597]
MASFAALPVAAQELETVGKPENGGVGFQPAVTEVARDLQWLDYMILWIITAIVILVCALLLIAIFRFNRKANPTPGTFTHNSPLEITWTIVPILILVFIGAFSLPTLFKQQTFPEGDINIKVTGYQWYWGYEYTDTESELAFDSYMIGQPYTMTSEDEETGARAYVLNEAMRAKLVANGYNEDEFLLATDTAVVIPVGATVVMTVTAADVIHAWTIPAFGVKQDAVPGRLAQLWFSADREGVYFGQCSELCGKDHAYMPITVKVVSPELYQAWLAASEEAGGYVDPSEIDVNS